jgi:hypothetical protein
MHHVKEPVVWLKKNFPKQVGGPSHSIPVLLSSGGGAAAADASYYSSRASLNGCCSLGSMSSSESWISYILYYTSTITYTRFLPRALRRLITCVQISTMPAMAGWRNFKRRSFVGGENQMKNLRSKSQIFLWGILYENFLFKERLLLFQELNNLQETISRK